MNSQFTWNVNIQKKYNIIYADPPWKYSTDVSRHYRCTPIKAIHKFPIDNLANKNCALFLWTPLTIITQAIETIERWGFRYAGVAFIWVKTYRNGLPVIGRGSWTRANAEICLMGIRGELKRKSAKVSQIVISPLREHSRKPDEVREKIVELLGNLPKIELFARQTTQGWDCWGNETSKFNGGESE